MDRRVGEVSGIRIISAAAAFLALSWLSGCGQSTETRLRATLATQSTGRILLPQGRVEITGELRLGPGAHDLEIVGSDTTFKVAAQFQGRAVLVVEGGSNIRFRDFSIDGGRDEIARPLEMVPPENALRVWYANNGILADRVEGLEIAAVHLAQVAGFPILVSRSSRIRIHDVTVEDSGSTNARRRNNLSGGILIEEGSKDFEVRNSNFRRILGNGLWTHSLRTSPRLENGVFAGNRFDTIGRDALQVGHATRIKVENNSGEKIGFPLEAVDAENGGTPVAIDTAGNVDQSEYSRNSFEEVNGKCIDLDGFHHGAVRGNRCTNRLSAEDYPHGHFGMVMNNTDPGAHSQNIELRGNVIDGARFGGLFLMGSGHQVTGNRFVRLNLAGCGQSVPGCIYKADEPRMLESGIYLGRGVARLERTQDNVIRSNEISGHGMRSRCIAAGPGVALAANTVSANTCRDDPRR